MDRIGNKNQKLIKSLIYIYFVFSLVYLFALGMDLNLNIMVEIIIVIFVSMLIKFFILNPLVLYGIFGISFLALILVNRFISPILIPLSERVFNLYENIIANLQGKENIESDNLMPFWIILMVWVSIYSAYILFKNKNIYLLFPLYLSFFLYYWYTYFDEAYFMISSFLFIFFILMSLDKYNKENIDIKSETVDDPLYKARLKTVTNYSILIIFIAII